MDVCVVLYRSDVGRLEPGLRAHDELLIVDNTDDNRGFARAANQAASGGSQSLLCFANTDGDLTADCLDLLEAVFTDENVVAAGPDIGPSWKIPVLPDGSPNYLSGCCLVVRRSAFENVGGFDERLFMYGEDVDLCWKLRRLGRLQYVPEAQYGHDSSRDRPFQSLHRAFRNSLVVARRHQGDAGTQQMLRDAAFSLRTGRVRHAVARLTGLIDYAMRARRWA